MGKKTETGSRSMVAEAVQVAWPAVLESFFVALAGMIDTMMVSTMGSYAVAAVGLTQQPKFIGLAVFFSINVAVSALVARRKGEGNQKNANTILLTALVMVLALCVVVTAASVALAAPFMHLAGSNPQTHDSAVTYFRIIMGGTVFNVISLTINAGQRGSGNTRIAMTTNVTSSIVNVVFNYLLIGGNLGFPRLGVAGAAIATVLGTVVACFMSIASLFHHNSYVSFRWMKELRFRPNMGDTRRIARFGSNMFVENLAMRVGFVATAVLAARLGTDEFAAHNVGMNVLGLAFSFADGMQVAAVALSGQALGAGEKQKAIRYGNICQRIGFGISVVLSALLLIGGRWFYGLYFQDEAIIQMGLLINRFTTVIVLLQISQIIFGGCLRAGGDVRYTLMASLVSVTAIRTIVTIVFTLVIPLGLSGIWLGVLSDQFSRFVFMSLRFRQGKWVNIAL